MPEKDMIASGDTRVTSADIGADREAQMLYTKLIFCFDAVDDEAIQTFEKQYLTTPEKRSFFHSLRQHSGYNEKQELVALNSFSIEELRTALSWHIKYSPFIPRFSKHFAHHNWTELIPTLEFITERKILTDELRSQLAEARS